MENFILTISYLVIGMLLRRVPLFPKDSANVLNLFVIYVSLPALILLKVPALVLSGDLLAPVLMPWGMLILSALLIFFTARAAGWGKGVTGALLLLVPLGNTSFLGIPMVKAFFREAGIPFAVLYDQLGSFLALATYGTFILAYYGKGASPELGGVARRVITFPPFIALLLAFLLLKGHTCPQPLQTLLSSLAATLVPVVMIAVGLQLTFRLEPGILPPLGFGLLVKLIIAPLCAWGFCSFFNFNTPAVRVSIFEAGMPPMVSAGALAIVADLSPKLTAALVGIGIIMSLVSLPILYNLF